MPSPRPPKSPLPSSLPLKRHEDIERRLATHYKNKGIYTKKGREIVRKRLEQLHQEEAKGRLSFEEQVEKTFLQRFEFMTHPDDPEVARYLNQLRSRIHILDLGNTLRLMRLRNTMMEKLRKGGYKPQHAVKVREALEHLNRDIAIHTAFAEAFTGVAKITTPREMERLIQEHHKRLNRPLESLKKDRS